MVKKAKDNDWLDLNTRAVFLEFTVYKPQRQPLRFLRPLGRVPQYRGRYNQGRDQGKSQCRDRSREVAPLRLLGMVE